MNTNVGQVVLVKDINPSTTYYSDSTDSYPQDLAEFNGKLYFSAADGENGRELWVSDGTVEGTQLVGDIAPGIGNYGDPNASFPEELFGFDDRLYFSADSGETGSELWISDGTAEGTQLLAEINPTENNAGTSLAFPAGSNPSNFTEFGGKLYFSANDGENGGELWVTEGTQLFIDINPGSTGLGNLYSSYSSAPSDFAELGDKLYFSANDGETGRELWVSDGTVGGTQLLADISPDVQGSYLYDYLDGSSPQGLVEFNDKIYFSANDDVSGRELWVTDGTTEGTQLLVDINPGINSYRYGFPGNYYYLDFPARSNPRDFVEFQDKLYFSARNNKTGRELWVTDGTAEGTQLVADINPEDNSYIRDLTVVGNELFFTADDGEVGKELFKLTIDDGNREITIDGTDNDDNLFGGDDAEQIRAVQEKNNPIARTCLLEFQQTISLILVNV